MSKTIQRIEELEEEIGYIENEMSTFDDQQQMLRLYGELKGIKQTRLESINEMIEFLEKLDGNGVYEISEIENKLKELNKEKERLEGKNE